MSPKSWAYHDIANLLSIIDQSTFIHGVTLMSYERQLDCLVNRLFSKENKGLLYCPPPDDRWFTLTEGQQCGPRFRMMTSSWKFYKSDISHLPYVHSAHFINMVQHIEAETNGRHFAYDISKCIFLNENVWIPIKISLKFVPKGQINNNPALVQIMA